MFKSTKIKILELEVKYLENKIERLEEGQSLVKHLRELDQKASIFRDLTTLDQSGDITLTIPTEYAKYVDDYYGGNVIEQIATKLVVIDDHGDVSYHYTAEEPDKGYSYKLERI